MGGVGTWVEELWIWLVAVFSTTVEKVGVVLTILAHCCPVKTRTESVG